MADSTAKSEALIFCVTCSFFYLDTDKVSEIGQCRRRAPTRNLDCSAACFPPVSPILWCGEHEQASDAQVQARKTFLKGI